MTDEIRKSVWERLLLADINMRYFGYLSRDYYRLDLGSKCFLAVMSSGTVGGWLVWNDPLQYPIGTIFWRTLSGVSAILAVVIPIVNFTKKLEVVLRLKAEWQRVMSEYDILWLRVESGSVDDKQTLALLEELRKEESKLDQLEATVPTQKKKLISLCQREAVNARGIQ